MDSRTAAHVLSQIAAFLELHGENRFKSRAYSAAARAVQALDVDDVRIRSEIDVYVTENDAIITAPHQTAIIPIMK